jgi:hypothetical protein
MSFFIKLGNWITAITLGFLFSLMASCTHIQTVNQPEEIRRPAQQICQWGSQPKSLSLVYPEQQILMGPHQVTIELDRDILIATFKVTTDPQKINAKVHLGPHEYPYQFDVVEIFISVNKFDLDDLHYYEFELSPYNENFQVLVESKNSKKKFTDHINMNIQTFTKIVEDGWIGQIKIPLKNLKWDGYPQSIMGNAFVVNGHGHERAYWSLFSPPQQKPNFHHLEFFRPLLGCGS